MKTRTRLQYVFYVTLSALAVCTSACKNENKFKTDEEKEHQLALEHNIKSIKEFKTAFLGDVPQKEIRSHEIFFNEDGNKIKEMDYSSETDKGLTITYEYDKKENLISSKCLNPDNSIVFKTMRNYYADGNRKDLYFYLPDGTYKYRNTAEYDEKGNMINLKWFWPTGFKAENKYTYNDTKPMENSEYNPEGVFLYKWVYKYDKRDNLIEAIQYYPNNSINSKIDYAYNTKNQLIKQDNIIGEFVQNSLIFEYNNKNLLCTKTEYSTSGIISSKVRFEYEYY